MGEINNVMNDYMSQSERFADFFNGTMFEGRNVVKPKGLKDASEKYNQSVVVNPRTKERGKSVERIRDLKKIYEDKACFRILGIEGQDYIDYASGVRGAEYDIMEYRNQIKRLTKSTESKVTKSELFSRMNRTDRLIPTYTIWFYYGTEPYDGPRCLSDMMDFSENDEFRRYFSDYKLNVICLNEIEDMSVFNTELRQLFKLMKCRENKELMRQTLKNDKDYADINEDTLYTMSVTLGKPKLWEQREKYLKNEGEVNYNMCLAFEQIEEDAREEGREEGENLLASLINKLLSSGRDKDISRVTTDVQYREKLYIQYGLKKSV
ncbi:MAG: Rpn family recombination-promoting nuclease/putative transposase [Lachnospiraceae bacterium]|nr:Rpn family recombination-promoting nuclease/putative transposase [Lachnospiraceae bacterium]